MAKVKQARGKNSKVRTLKIQSEEVKQYDTPRSKELEAACYHRFRSNGHSANAVVLKKKGDEGKLDPSKRSSISIKGLEESGGFKNYGTVRADRLIKRMDEAEQEFKGADAIKALLSAVGKPGEVGSVPLAMTKLGLKADANRITKRAASFKPITVPPAGQSSGAKNQRASEGKSSTKH